MTTFLKYPQHPIITPPSILGILLISIKILTFLKWVYKSFLRQPKPLLKYGSWAVITGPTDGIGKALAFQLASKSLNLILIGRNLLKLQQTSNEILKKYYDKNIQIKLLVIDFSKIRGEEIERVIKEEINGIEIGILINNVGYLNDAKYFHEGDVEFCVLYVAMFSRSLHVEYKRYGIDIQCQIPFYVATKMVPTKRPSFFAPSPEQYSKASIRWMGYDLVCVPYWTHALQLFLIRPLPDSLVDWLLLKSHSEGIPLSKLPASIIFGA